jgi:hypothetical protein
VEILSTPHKYAESMILMAETAGPYDRAPQRNSLRRQAEMRAQGLRENL